MGLFFPQPTWDGSGKVFKILRIGGGKVFKIFELVVVKSSKSLELAVVKYSEFWELVVVMSSNLRNRYMLGYYVHITVLIIY